MSSEKKETITHNKLRIYGIPIVEVHDKNLVPLTESNKDYPFEGIIYCGFKSEYSELRNPTKRLWYFEKSNVIDTGVVEDYRIEEGRVHYYEVNSSIKIYEKKFVELSLGEETLEKSRIFAEGVVTSPSTSLTVDWLQKMSHEEIEKFVSSMIDAPKPLFNNCSLYVQTNTGTVYDPFTRSDADGADCQND
jgi:hypothetical protein